MEEALSELFNYDDNDPETYENCRMISDIVKAYCFNPLVKLKRKTAERLKLLLKIGEYIYSYESRPDDAIYPFE
jgi:hypothetical protein